MLRPTHALQRSAMQQNPRARDNRRAACLELAVDVCNRVCLGSNSQRRASHTWAVAGGTQLRQAQFPRPALQQSTAWPRRAGTALPHRAVQRDQPKCCLIVAGGLCWHQVHACLVSEAYACSQLSMHNLGGRLCIWYPPFPPVSSLLTTSQFLAEPNKPLAMTIKCRGP
jgi:hypothetical protein